MNDQSNTFAQPRTTSRPMPHWRPINPRQDTFEPRGVQLADWPDDRTVLYWWRYRDPRAWIRQR